MANRIEHIIVNFIRNDDKSILILCFHWKLNEMLVLTVVWMAAIDYMCNLT